MTDVPGDLAVEPTGAPTAPAGAPPAPTRRRKGRRPMNPVLARELRIRLRGARSWILLTGFLLFLGAILLLVFSVATGEAKRTQPVIGDDFGFEIVATATTQFSSIGREMFESLILVMLVLVLFLVPGLTSGAIAGERERQTLVPLQVTLLRPWQLVVGKLAASFAYLALLIVAAAPLLGITYLVGGITVATVFKGVAVVLYTGLILAAITVFCSTVFRSVQTATVMAYGAVFLMLAGTTLAWGAASSIDGSRGTDLVDPPREILVANPLFLATDAIVDRDALLRGDRSPFKWFASELYKADVQRLENQFVDPRFGFANDAPVFQQIDVDDAGNITIADPNDDRFPFWAQSAIFLYFLAVAGSVVAVRRLRTPARTER